MKHKSGALAALLSFVLPGLGHAFLGSSRQALVFALPVVVVATVVGAAALAGIDAVVANLITPSGAMTALVLIVLTGAWRLLAMLDAVRVARRRRLIGTGGLLLAAVLAAASVAAHGGAGMVAYSVWDASSDIFVSAGPDDHDPPASGPGGSGGTAAENPSAPGTAPSVEPTDDYHAAPEATPATREARINILLTGVDSAETRTTSLTDTLLVLSVDPTARTAVMISFPRDISNFPLYDGRTFRGKINSLMTYARNHRDEFPDGPFPTLIKEIGHLLGVPIHYYAAVDLQGFRRLVDEVGGVTVDNPRVIDDPRYEWLDGTFGFHLDAGKVQLDGRRALAYARSRQGLGDNDFTRAARQQQLLTALRAKLTSPEMLPRLPGIIDVAGDTIRTNLPTDRLEEFIGLAREIKGDAIDRYVLGPPYSYHPPTKSTDGVYTLELRMNRLADLSRELFGDDSRYAR